MKRSYFAKSVFILLVIALGVVLILPTVGEKQMQISFAGQLTQEDKDLVQKRFPADSFEVTLAEKSALIKGYNLSDAVMNEVKTWNSVEDTVFLPHWSEDPFRLVGKSWLAKKINLGLDLQGGMLLVLQADYDKMSEKRGKALTEDEKREITSQALEKINNRINTFGVSEPSIRTKGTEAIEIQLPGVRNPESVKKAIGTTGSVEYHLVNDEATARVAALVKNEADGIPSDIKEQAALIERLTQGANIGDDSKVLFYYERDENTNVIYPAYPIVLYNQVELNGDDIALATEGTDDMGRPAVSFNTTQEGALKFSEVTSKKNHGKRLAIVIDDKVRSAPSLSVQINGGRAIIQGSFSTNEVQVLARIINEGALPVDLKVIEERTVGPSLGQDSIEAGMRAVAIGLAGVMLFMLVYYKASGLVADICLVLNMIFMLAVLSLLGATLTLPGIAGFILTVGMAVDANVIIYERIKEELRSGKSVRTAVVNGYDRAFWTIFDSNLTTLIAAIILSRVGTGPIKGFAVTLMIGILCSMFVALYISKFIFMMITQNKSLKKLSI